MSRKKATKRKVKVTDSHSTPSPNSSTMELGKKSPEEHSPQAEQDLPGDSTSSQMNLMPVHWNKQNHSGKISSLAVKIKTEPNLELALQTCTGEGNTQDIHTSKQNNPSTFKPAKIKRERLSLDSSVSSGSAHQFPTMDLGSHLEQSLSSLQSGPDLTWSQLLEAKNLPKVHIPDRLKSKAALKNERTRLDLVCPTDDNTENLSLNVDAEKNSTLGKSSAGSGKGSETGLSGSGAGLTSSGNRFSKNYDSTVLDLSKKSIPVEIRRVLASKYGVVKRNEDGHAGNVVPNFNKSRSRFTHSLKKTGTTDSEDESNNRSEVSTSGQLSSMKDNQRSDVQNSRTQPSTDPSQELTQSSGMPKSKSVSPTDYPVSIPAPAKVPHRRRFSSSTYERRKSEDRRVVATDKLQSRGLVDLGSHYGSLLKDSPPPLAGRRSASPYEDSAALDRDKEMTSMPNQGVPQEQRDMRQSAFDDRNAIPTTSASELAKRLVEGVRRSSFSGGSSENSESVNSRGDTLRHRGGQKSNEAGPLRVSGRNSRSPVDLDLEYRSTEETMVDHGSRSRFGQHKDPLHSSARSSSRSPLGDVITSGGGPMIDLNTSTKQLSKRTSQLRRKCPFSSSIEAPSRATDTNKGMVDRDNLLEDDNRTKRPDKSSLYSLPRTSSRSPVRTERSTPPNIKGPMIELAGNKHFDDYLENAKHANARSLSRSPVRTEVTRSPNEPMVELGSGKHEHQSSTKHAASRSQSRSSVSSDHSNKSGQVETIIGSGSADRLTEQHRSKSRSPRPSNEAMIGSGSADRLTEQHRSKSRSPRPSNEAMIGSGSADRLTEQHRSKSRSPRPSNEAMIDLSSTSRLHERRGAPRMKPLDGMIDLNSMDNPASPLSPGFGILPFSSFPSQIYRPPNRQRYSYKSKHYRGLPHRGTSPALNSPALNSSGFSPRLPFGPHFSYPPNQRHRMPGSAVVDLGSLAKSNEFHGAGSSRSSEIPLQPVRSGTIPKRRHSMDSSSLNEPAKKPRVTVTGQQQDLKPAGSGIRLNVNDLLELEREEQKYIQNLSMVQSQLTEIQFKMQRMQQQLEKLQSSEIEIKQRIDVVRARRVKILKDAQDNQESQGTSGVIGDSDMNTRRNKEGGGIGKQIGDAGHVGAVRGNEGDAVKERDSECDKEDNQEIDKTYSGGSLGFRSDERRDTRKHNSSGGKSDNDSQMIGFGGSSEYRNMSNDRHLAPSELVSRDMNNARHPRVSTIAPIVQQYPITSSSNDRSYHNVVKPTTRRVDSDGSSLSTSQEKLSAGIETFESSNGSTITLNSDGTLVLRKSNPVTSHDARKRSNPTILEEACVEFNGKEAEYAGITPNESQQFLGCLEITSTTDEPLTNDDDGPKEVLAEKERECLASRLRCDQDRISSTVSSLEIEQDDGGAGSGCEMDFVGHTDAVCYILPYKGKLFSASADKTAKVFDLKTGSCIKTFQGHDLAVNCLQISGFGGKTDRLFTGANDQSVRAYNIQSGACTHKFSFRGRVMCLHVAFGKLFIGLSSGFVAVIDLKTNECIDQFNCHEPSRISCLASATEGQRSLLCTGSFDSTITIRDQSTGLLLRHIKDHKLTVLCMDVVENILYSGSADTVVQSHNINTGELVRSYTGHTMSVSGLQALGGVLVTSSLDRIIRCFDIKTGDLLQLYGGSTDMIFSLSVIGDMIYTGCRDGRVSGIKLDLRKYHCCKWGDCSLKFGLFSHLKQHVQDHINQIVDFKSCFWDKCVHKFPRGKQVDVIEAATEHIMSHIPNTNE